MRLSRLDQYIDLILSNQDVKKGKPDPEMYLKAMKYFSLDPSECLILEDNEHGIQAAIASGGHLMRVGIPDDVIYTDIMKKIQKIDSH